MAWTYWTRDLVNKKNGICEGKKWISSALNGQSRALNGLAMVDNGWRPFKMSIPYIVYSWIHRSTEFHILFSFFVAWMDSATWQWYWSISHYIIFILVYTLCNWIWCSNAAVDQSINSESNIMSTEEESEICTKITVNTCLASLVRLMDPSNKFLLVKISRIFQRMQDL